MGGVRDADQSRSGSPDTTAGCSLRSVHHLLQLGVGGGGGALMDALVSQDMAVWIQQPTAPWGQLIVFMFFFSQVLGLRSVPEQSAA